MKKQKLRFKDLTVEHINKLKEIYLNKQTSWDTKE